MKMQRDGEKLIIFAQGRIDTNRAPQIGDEVQQALDGVRELIFDFSQLEYISSSGLRVLMLAIKTVREQQGEASIVNVNEDIYEILEITGFIGVCDVSQEGSGC